LDDQGVYSYRVAGLFDDADGQVEHTETRRQSLSSAFTWRPDDATSLTLLGHFQKDPKGASYGSVPAWGSVLHSPTGRSIDVDFYDGEKNFEKSDREYYTSGYAFEHHFNDVWTVRQNARYLRSEGQYRSLYSNYLMADYRTIRRSTIASDVNIDAYTLDNQLQAKFDTGPLQHTLLMGARLPEHQHRHQVRHRRVHRRPDPGYFQPGLRRRSAGAGLHQRRYFPQRANRRVPAGTDEVGPVGAAVGEYDGECVGDTDGLVDGDVVGVASEGDIVGERVGLFEVGDADGESDGVADVGGRVGESVGRIVGDTEGAVEGETDGRCVEGEIVGEVVVDCAGAAVGEEL